MPMQSERGGKKPPPDDWPHYAAKKAIGPKQLNEEEAKNTARRAFRNNSGLTSSEIGKAIGRSRRTAGSYIADLRAAVQMDLDLKIFRIHRLEIPQARIAKRLGTTRDIIRDHLGIMPTLAKSPNSDLSRSFTVPQVAEKYGWTEPMLWSLAWKENMTLSEKIYPEKSISTLSRKKYFGTF